MASFSVFRTESGWQWTCTPVLLLPKAPMDNRQIQKYQLDKIELINHVPPAHNVRNEPQLCLSKWAFLILVLSTQIQSPCPTCGIKLRKGNQKRVDWANGKTKPSSTWKQTHKGFPLHFRDIPTPIKLRQKLCPLSCCELDSCLLCLYIFF